jgi:signal transduction histidine kinase
VPRDDGTDLVLLRVTQIAMLVRLGSMIPVVWAAVAAPLGTPWLPIGYVIVALLGFAVLMLPIARRIVAQHPLVVVLDSLLLAAVAVAAGTDSAFVLTFMTSALMIGLWSRLWVGMVQLVALVSLQFALAFLGGEPRSSRLLIVPFVLVTLWLLGMVVRRSAASARDAQTALRAAISSAAASQERTRLAREMHDSVAKSLQGINLTAAALSQLADGDSGRGKTEARAIQDQSIVAIGEVRRLIGELRLSTSEQPMDVVIGQLLDEWEARTGIKVRRLLAAGIVVDDSTRYELLMVLAEGLENVKRHAAASRVTVELAVVGEKVELSLADDGTGVDVTQLLQAESDGHFGVRGMRERMAGVGGVLDWVSRPNAGTRITARVHRQGLIEADATGGSR